MAKLGSKPIDELVRRAIIGDGTAFTQLWDTHIAGLRTYLKTTMKLTDDFYIDDICSRSFEKAFRQIQTYDPVKSQFATWLRVIAHNTALDTIEQENRVQKSYVYLDDDKTQAAIIENIGDDEDTPLESIINTETQEETRGYIEGLPELYREIARDRLLDGMQYKEIADKEGIELNTVRTRIRRAKALIDKMKKDSK
ncbi:MAG: RNA polymerase sigma factor [Bacteroidia bacterium]|nr:RNA polymerase sigma factor [Bacteroidia bacterium]